MEGKLTRHNHKQIPHPTQHQRSRQTNTLQRPGKCEFGLQGFTKKEKQKYFISSPLLLLLLLLLISPFRILEAISPNPGKVTPGISSHPRYGQRHNFLCLFCNELHKTSRCLPPGRRTEKLPSTGSNTDGHLERRGEAR